MRNLVMIMTALLMLPVLSFASGEVNQKMIAEVLSGKVKTAKASWWGFNPEDSTDSLQAAINSGAKKLVIENLGKPWIVRPMKLASDQEIVFSRGVEVLAKQGEFLGTNDCLFRSEGGKNITLSGYDATLRMRRDEYAKPPYKKAEWRMGIAFFSCSNVTVRGLTITESGGDGILLCTSGSGATNKDIKIKDVILDKNYRQGISVTNAENLLIENTIMRNTGGTAPQAGIDFEPDLQTERLVNIVVRKCKTEHNGWVGYLLFIPNLDAASAPVSIRFEKCVSIGDTDSSVYLQTRNVPKETVTGKIEFVDCSFKDAPNAGVQVIDVPSKSLAVRFINCSISAAEKTATAPIIIRSTSTAKNPVGFAEFTNCTVWERPNRNPLVYNNEGNMPMQGVSGTLNLKSKGKQRTVELTPQVLDAWAAPTIPAGK